MKRVAGVLTLETEETTAITNAGFSTGAVIQTVHTTSTAVDSATGASEVIPVDNTTPQNTEGRAYSGLNTTITPTSATSILEVQVHIPIVSGSTAIDVILALFRDSGADALYADVVTVTNNNYHHNRTFIFRVVAGSTSATTFKLRFGPHTAAVTAYINRTSGTAAYFNGKAVASMIVREVAP